MTITYQAKGTLQQVSSGNVTLVEDGSAADGDLLIAFISWPQGSVFTDPSGWTTAASVPAPEDGIGDTSDSRGNMRLLWKIRSGAPALGFTRTGGSNAFGNVYRARSGIGGTIAVAGGNGRRHTSGTNLIPPMNIPFASIGASNFVFTAFALGRHQTATFSSIDNCTSGTQRENSIHNGAGDNAGIIVGTSVGPASGDIGAGAIPTTDFPAKGTGYTIAFYDTPASTSKALFMGMSQAGVLIVPVAEAARGLLNMIGYRRLRGPSSPIRWAMEGA